ncbi:hypothetical protein RIR_jg25437.t1 [Rhizophagus irregularis DAOM 181602=DAOM 197198]|nr:hypothetical protein RIR_jg25437.t1 [Rhizophagus irregularis DAOM 181602=DAOM 197198]
MMLLQSQDINDFELCESTRNSVEWACHQRSASTFSSHGKARYLSISAKSGLGEEGREVCDCGFWKDRRKIVHAGITKRA